MQGTICSKYTARKIIICKEGRWWCGGGCGKGWWCGGRVVCWYAVWLGC